MDESISLKYFQQVTSVLISQYVEGTAILQSLQHFYNLLPKNSINTIKQKNMKWLIITILLAIQCTTFAQEDNKFEFITEKETYKTGEVITAELKSKKPFALATDGDCSSSVLPTYYIKQIDDKWPVPEGVKQMCCGLPCTMNTLKKMNPQITIESKGKYKMVVYTCSGVAVSNAFEVSE